DASRPPALPSPALPLRASPPPLFPYTTLFRSAVLARGGAGLPGGRGSVGDGALSTRGRREHVVPGVDHHAVDAAVEPGAGGGRRSEEHTSELQSRENLVCRLLLEKKKDEAGAR